MAATLFEILQSLKEDEMLNDGATTWGKWNLIDALSESDEGQALLKERVYLDASGIFRYKPDGYLESLPIYSIVQS